jgi:hypothetical protein
MNHGMKNLQNGALGESHLRRLANRNEPGIDLHRFGLELVALILEVCANEPDIIRVGPGPGVRHLAEGKKAG